MSTPSAKDTMLKQDMGRLTARFAEILGTAREELLNVVGAMPRDPEADMVAAQARTVAQMIGPLEEEAREMGSLWSRVALAQWSERRADRDGRVIELLEDCGFEQNDGGWGHVTIEVTYRAKWDAVRRISADWADYPDLQDRAQRLLREREDEEGES